METRLPRVSIGLPVYNGEKYLAAAIDSLLAQSFTDLELIISDNASTDRTSEICRQYASKDNRVRYYREPKNRGIAWNFTRTFELARGEFFQWHAHDDLCAPTLLERCVDAFDQDPEAVLCYPRPAVIDERGELLPDDAATWRPPVDAKQRASSTSRGDLRGLDSSLVSRRFRGVLMETVWCLESYGMVRTAVMRTTGKLRRYPGAEKVFLAEMALRGRFREIPEILFFCRRHTQQYTMLDSATAQRNSVNPRGFRQQLPIPRQLRSTLGYLLLLPAAPISLVDRLHCFGVVIRYVLQVSKWKRIVVNTLNDVAIHDGYLQVPTSRPQTDVASDLSITRRSSATANSA